MSAFSPLPARAGSEAREGVSSQTGDGLLGVPAPLSGKVRVRTRSGRIGVISRAAYRPEMGVPLDAPCSAPVEVPPARKTPRSQCALPAVVYTSANGFVLSGLSLDLLHCLYDLPDGAPLPMAKHLGKELACDPGRIGMCFRVLDRVGALRILRSVSRGGRHERTVELAENCRVLSTAERPEPEPRKRGRTDDRLYDMLCGWDQTVPLPSTSSFAMLLALSPTGVHHVLDALQRSGRIVHWHGSTSLHKGERAIRIVATGAVLRTLNAPPEWVI